MFRSLRSFIRARARKKRADRARQQRERAKWECFERDCRDRIDAQKDDAYDALASALMLSQCPRLHETQILALRDCLRFNGWRFDRIEP